MVTLEITMMVCIMVPTLPVNLALLREWVEEGATQLTSLINILKGLRQCLALHYTKLKSSIESGHPSHERTMDIPLHLKKFPHKTQSLLCAPPTTHNP
jgi:hypothetical protein